METGSVEIVNSLKQYVPNRKSYENSYLLRLPEMSDEITWEFIRGFFDGDGSISKCTAEICCVSKNFSEDLLKWFIKNEMNPKFEIRLPKRVKDKQIMYRIRFRKDDVKILCKMYKSGCICLERKREKIFSFADRVRVDSPKKLCPKCSSLSLIHYGNKFSSSGKIIPRFFCNFCKKYFNNLKF